jgi:hypothetical protein
MKIRIALFAIALLIAAPGTILASEIYRWTDDDGVVHYSDLPTGAEGEEHLAIQSRPTDLARILADDQARVDAQTLKAEQEANAPKGPTAEELQAEAREKKDNCSKYRARQASFIQNRRIYQLDESGERVYYDEEEMATARAGVDDLVKQHCD